MAHSIAFCMLYEILTSIHCSIIPNEENKFRKVMKDHGKTETIIPLIFTISKPNKGGGEIKKCLISRLERQGAPGWLNLLGICFWFRS